MLSELYIENLAVIEKAIIPFSDNLNIFTGETGAGKSILINGINAILGQRVTKDIVRTGCNKAIVTAFFKDIPTTAVNLLSDLGFSTEDNQITVTREISADGGSVCRINYRVCTVAILKELGEILINIHGQHDNQILLHPEKHIEILDVYGELEDNIQDYRKSFKELQDTARHINQLSLDEKDKNKRIEYLKYVIDEIGTLEIEENEDIKIEEEYKIAKDIDRILNSLYASKEIINGDEDGNIITNIDSVSDNLNDITDVLPSAAVLSERVSSAKIELSDICEEITDLIDKQNIDEERFNYLSERREALIQIKRKYGPELSDVINTYSNSLKEYNSLLSNENNLDALKSEKSKLLNIVTEKAKRLSQSRRNAAQKFIKEVTDELSFLNMPNVKLVVSQEKGKLTINGMDNIEFKISANIGEEPRPIAKIASGGELSRIMLALKNVLAEKDNIPTLIFDEIDTGVSGRAAQKIGIKLHQIAKLRQVICVTHLAQIAIMADNHLLIEKNVVDNRTVTSVTNLDFNGQKNEIARIIGGNNITDLTIKNAEEMLKSKENLIFDEKK